MFSIINIYNYNTIQYSQDIAVYISFSFISYIILKLAHLKYASLNIIIYIKE